MHELSITQNILKIVLDYAEKSQAKSIKNIYLVIGQLSSIVDDSVQFYWDMISEDSIALGAKLHFKKLGLIIKCKECGDEYSPSSEDLSCPECKSSNIQILQGEEFFIEAIDIEK